MFDIATTDILTASEAGRPMVLSHPSTGRPFIGDDGKPVSITLRGRHSALAQDVLRQINDERAAIEAEGRRITRDENERFNTRYLVALTVGWTFTKMAGEDFPCTPANAERLWSDSRFRHWRERALIFVGEDGNFLAASA
jgi:hypothetical protein